MPIRKLLVANRGEIAVRVLRTCRELDIATVAVCSDADAGAPHVRAADEVVALPGVAPRDTYLRGDLLVAAALATGAEAVHPGYGFLSEDAGFAQAVADAGLTFVGPPPAAIAAMGSKIGARERMAAAGVPVLPGATLTGEEALGAVAAELGFPLLVKAAFGGGGRGMRAVRDAGELADAVAGARREAASAFGDGTVFLERLVERPRHVEVQVVGDCFGTVVSLFERECSIQRRYQKIVEEAPSPAVGAALRAELGGAAVTAAKAIGYVGAGTVEFILDPSGAFFFLEVNTRLQVEHPVTELVTGLDLVRVQLQVAEGQPLPPEVLDAELRGHAVEARLYAEDPAEGFRPAAGTLHRFAVPDLPGVRVDTGVADGDVVGVHYDPLLAKVIAHGATRDQACRRLARALAEARIHGVTTNRDLLVAILREGEFRAGAIDTAYLERHPPATLAGPPDGEQLRVHAAAAALAGQALRRRDAAVQRAAPSGWRNVHSEDQHARLTTGGRELEVRYRLARDGDRVAVDGVPLEGVAVHHATPGAVDLTVAGVRRRLEVHLAGEHAFVDGAGRSTAFTEAPRFAAPTAEAAAGSLLAPMPGTVVRVAVAPGEHVTAGTPIVVLEAMKMEHTISAPHDGTVTDLPTTPGQTVDTGAVLAVVLAAVEATPDPEPPDPEPLDPEPPDPEPTPPKPELPPTPLSRSASEADHQNPDGRSDSEADRDTGPADVGRAG